MSLSLERLTICRHPSRQLVTPGGRQGHALLLPLLHDRRDQSLLRCRLLRNMHAQACSAQSEKFHFLITSSDDGSLAALRSSLSQVSCICWRSVQPGSIRQWRCITSILVLPVHRRTSPLHQTPLQCLVSS